MVTGAEDSVLGMVMTCQGSPCRGVQMEPVPVAEALAEQIHGGGLGMNPMQKLKVGVCGCPNDCIRCAMSDIGIQGQGGRTGWRITLGGRWDRGMVKGQTLDRLFTTQEEVVALVRRVAELYRAERRVGETFADLVERLGFAAIEKKLLANENG